MDSRRAGEKLFVDWAGDRIAIHDRDSSDVRYASLFVIAWGASSYTYAEATFTQTLPDWIGFPQESVIGFVQESVIGFRQESMIGIRQE